MNIFDYIKIYNKEWKEENSRKFTPEEQERIISVEVVAGEHGKSACFLSSKGYQYISLEPSSAALVSIGDILDIKTLTFVQLKYVGTRADQKIKECFKIRIDKDIQSPMTFDNPFGL